ncbi:tail fiber domain-containing protein [Ahniella affigens]|nr:tail fiber domain-containing protein [Ahniella affigens]
MKRTCLMLSMMTLLSAHAGAETMDGRAEHVQPKPQAQALAPLPGLQAAGSDRDVPSKDNVIADDLVVQGSGCFGFDCVNNEDFGFDTIRLKENNLRIKFDDTSTGNFPANDWQLTANDTTSDAANRFSIDDITGAKTPFTVMAGAPTNSLFIDPNGRIGLRTGTPALDLQITTGNTPGMRLEQTNASGFTAQTWDVAGNEANFFVRDVTAGSRLPFRIRPGAANSAVDISAAGVAITGAGATANLDVRETVLVGTPDASLRVSNTAYPSTEQVRFEVDSDGNVTARGAITQLSSRTSKEGFVDVDGRSVLERLAGLPIREWNYIGRPETDRHVGPVAEEFHQAFGLGQDERTISLSDMAGVALAAVKELNTELQRRDQQIAEQERRLRALEAKLAELTQD